MNTQNLELKVGIGAMQYDIIKTQIKLPLENQYYYLPTDYKEPIKCRLVDYIPTLSVDKIIRIMATVNIGKFSGLIQDIKLKDVQPELLFNSKDKASQHYLDHKDELNWEYLYK